MQKIARSIRRLIRRFTVSRQAASEMENLQEKLRVVDRDREELFPLEPGDCCRDCCYGYSFTQWCDKNARRAHRLAWLIHKKDIPDKAAQIKRLYWDHGEVEEIGPYPKEAYEV